MNNNGYFNQEQPLYHPGYNNAQPNSFYCFYTMNSPYDNPYQLSSFTSCVTNNMNNVLNITKDTSISDVTSITLGAGLGIIEYLLKKLL